VRELYADSDEWARKAIFNVTGSGKLSSDGARAESETDIWNAKLCLVDPREISSPHQRKEESCQSAH